MIRTSTEIQLIASLACTVGGPAGMGKFTVEEDRLKLTPVLTGALERKLLSLLRAQDVVGYSVLLSMQSVHLFNFPVGKRMEPVPGFVAPADSELDAASLAASRFMYQNGFETLHDVDDAGWSPLHYAALGGDPLVMQGLLAQRADPDCPTQKDQPLTGTAPMATALNIAVFHTHNDAARLLILSRAKVDLGLAPALHLAAHANNPEGIRLLLDAGYDPCKRDFLGIHALVAGCTFGSVEAVEELFIRARHSIEVSDLTHGLQFATAVYGGTSELVHTLVQPM